VVVGVTIAAEGEALTIEHEQDLHHNVKQQESSRDPCVHKSSTRCGTSKLPK
jgi:hypothetical protein